MSKAATTKPAAPKPAPPKAAFRAASFAGFRAVTGESQGEPMRVPLVDIDEDPNQPRKVFDQEELASFADAIRLKGVLQPIGLRPGEEGRYLLVFGARRFRASRLAGLPDIPALIVPEGQRDYATQVMENQQRANLSNSDLAAAVEQLAGEKHTNKQIAAICNLRDYQVAALRQVPSFPAFLAGRLNTADMRALYDLFRQWGKTPAEVEAAMPDAETFLTITEARRIIGSITGKATGSIVLDRRQAQPQEAPEPRQEPSLPPEAASARGSAEPAQDARPGKPQALSESTGDAGPSSPSGPASEPAERPRKAEAVALAEHPAAASPEPVASRAQRQEGPVFYVAAGDGQRGRLITDRRAEREGWALVAYEAGVEEVEAASLRLVAIE